MLSLSVVDPLIEISTSGFRQPSINCDRDTWEKPVRRKDLFGITVSEIAVFISLT